MVPQEVQVPLVQQVQQVELVLEDQQGPLVLGDKLETLEGQVPQDPQEHQAGMEDQALQE